MTLAGRSKVTAVVAKATADERGMMCPAGSVVAAATLAAWILVAASVAALIVGGTAKAKEVVTWWALSMALVAMVGPAVFFALQALRDWWLSRSNPQALRPRSDASQL